MSTVTSSQTCNAHPDVACARILSEAGIKAWWVGGVTVKEADPTWPAVGSRMVWRAGGGKFRARVTTDARPLSVEMFVETPSADSTVTHTFEALPNGGTKYTKSVEPKWRSGFARFMGPIFIPLLRAAVKSEVKRATKYADLPTT